MKSSLKSLPKLSVEAVEIACSIEGGCPPSHRLARRVSTAIIAFLLVTLVGCGAYIMWSHRL